MGRLTFCYTLHLPFRSKYDWEGRSIVESYGAVVFFTLSLSPSFLTATFADWKGCTRRRRHTQTQHSVVYTVNAHTHVLYIYIYIYIVLAIATTAARSWEA